MGLLAINFYIGEGNSNGSQDCFRLKASQMAGSFCKFPKRHLHYNWKFGFSLEDLEVRDFISNSTVDRALHTLEPKTLFTLAVESVFPAPLCNSSTEYVIAMHMQPIQINIDHIHILNRIESLLYITDNTPKTITDDLMRKLGDAKTALDREALVNEASSVIKNAKTLYSQLSIYLQRIELSPIYIAVNFIPNGTAITTCTKTKMILPMLLSNLIFECPPVLLRAGGDLFTAGTFIDNIYRSYKLTRHMETRMAELMSPKKLFSLVLELGIGSVLKPVIPLLFGGLPGLFLLIVYYLRRFDIFAILGARISIRSYGIVQKSFKLFGVHIPSRQRVFESLVHEMEYREGILRPL